MHRARYIANAHFAAIGRAARSAQRQGRIEDYAELRRQGVDLHEAARRLCVSTRTIERYRAQLNKQGRDQ